MLSLNEYQTILKILSKPGPKAMVSPVKCQQRWHPLRLGYLAVVSFEVILRPYFLPELVFEILMDYGWPWPSFEVRSRVQTGL